MKPTLDEALAAFRRTRSADITPLIIERGAEAGASFIQPKERKNIALHRAWLEAVKSKPESLTWALSALTTQLPKLVDGKEHPFGDQSEALVERVNALRTVPVDPRISTALVALAELSPPVTGFLDITMAMVDVMALHADDSTLDSIPKRFVDAAELKKRTFPKKVALAAADAVFRAPRKTAPANTKEAWNAVYAAPNDDAPREVLADLLLEQGDPRGEFISIQLREARGQATPAEVERARALVKQHGKQWLGSLRPAVSKAEFRRGFLWSIELAGSWATSSWDAHTKDPQLGTVEVLRSGKAISRGVAPFLVAGTMKHLKVAPAFDEVLIETLRAHAPKTLETIEWPLPTKEFFSLLEATPSVTALTFPNRIVASDAKSWPKAVRHRLRRLSSADDVTVASVLWPLFPKLEVLELGFRFKIALFRDDPTHAHVTADGATRSGLKGLPASVKRVDFSGSKAFCDRLAKAERKLKFAFISPPSGLVTNPKG